MKNAILKALHSGATFAIYRYPGEDSYRFIADIKGHEPISSDTFTIKPWGDRPAVIIHDTISPEDFSAIPLPSQPIAQPDMHPTEKSSYIKGIANVVDMLRREGGKVVISRTDILADPNLSIERIVDAIFDIFDHSPHAFRYIFHTPELGAWSGATPETLIDFNASNRTFRTMALAGTKYEPNYEVRGTNYEIPSEIEGWDEKNIHEHRIVADFILTQLRNAGVEAVIEPTTTLRLVHISHLLTPIHGVAWGMSAADIADILHPTPAIAGFPRDRALRVIDRIETHNRECYAGYLMAAEGLRTRAYVNLRCFQFAPGICCFYGGGGIVADSDPQTEFVESSLKIAATKSFFTRQ